jgi:ABC-2 type transport system ATP-binding protein
MAEKVLSVKNLTICFPHKVLLEDISFEVIRGERICIYGEAESGKTSLLLSLCGLKPFYDGSVSLFGYPVEDRRERYKRYLGVVPQQPCLPEKLSVGENIDFIASIYGYKTGSREYVSRRDHLLEVMELQEDTGEKIGVLSRGQKKRLMLACALIHEPQLLLLDDLISSVDERSASILLQAVEEYGKRGGTYISTASGITGTDPYTKIGRIKDRKLSFYSPEEFRELCSSLTKGWVW